MAIQYDSSQIYITGTDDLDERITRIKQVMSALLTSFLTGAGTANYEEYQLDDGQTKIRTTYRNIKEVTEAYDGLERLLERLQALRGNRTNGRVIRLRDSSNFV